MALKSFTFLSDNALNYKGTSIGVKPPKGKARRNLRTRGEILQDLSRSANQHNGDTYTVVCWQAIDLARNMSKAKTHFFAITLKRNIASSDPLTLYSLVDADVLPFSILDKKYEHAAVVHPDPEIGHVQGVNPASILRDNEQERIRNGGLGAVLLMAVELAEDELHKTPEQAVIDTSCPTFQPLGLFKAHRDSIGRLPPMPKQIWRVCLKNALDGNAYAMTVQPRPTPP
ncbi:hypothetical protein BT96DRAFT_994216 [Gymnopus androsaceus JB14]|uniref:Uncharacterized protein n=1 Tax=Gymnopus androsaceus JB14 TaxID=1447944 RepID=A0A6A4HLZ6_9AGAR|nr:hypothetical protein BT96DRAFT_994216 [Gymnopus androsaceus JB14]